MMFLNRRRELKEQKRAEALLRRETLIEEQRYRDETERMAVENRRRELDIQADRLHFEREKWRSKNVQP